MEKIIKSALISVYNKTGLDILVKELNNLGVLLYSTGGTHSFIEQLGIPCTLLEQVTGYPSILGGRVKTLHPKVFGGILARRENENDIEDLKKYELPLFDLVIVDLYPFEETLKNTNEEALIIEKIDIGGVSLIRAAAKNFADVSILASIEQYADFTTLLKNKKGHTDLEDRRLLAAAAFKICAAYDIAISNYFNEEKITISKEDIGVKRKDLRYGENPHQKALFKGDLEKLFIQLNGKELSYNNLVDIHAAYGAIEEFNEPTFIVIKHTNICGIAQRETALNAWQAALACDPESAFGGVIITNEKIDIETAQLINDLFFEILIAPAYDTQALELLKNKKNRILLLKTGREEFKQESKVLLDGVLVQDTDTRNFEKWIESGARETTCEEKLDLEIANIICKHLKSNAIAIVKNKQLIGKGCGQTSRIDALKQALSKIEQFGFSAENAVMASDAFFPFVDCVEMAQKAGIKAIIQPGGSLRDNDSINYCKENNMAMVITGTRHFKH